MTKRSLAFTAVVFLVAIPLVAQMGPRRGRGPMHYDPATEVTVKGTVQEVSEMTGRRGHTGVHLTLKTEQGVYEVHAGPLWYLSDQQFTVAKGDSLEITGSKTTIGGSEALVARQIVKEGKTLTLRDEQGFPKWSRAAAQQKP